MTSYIQELVRWYVEMYQRDRKQFLAHMAIIAFSALTTAAIMLK